MKLKIISDGTPAGTTIVNAETGEKLEFVHKVEWSMEAGHIAEAKLHILKMEAEFTGDFDTDPADDFEKN